MRRSSGGGGGGSSGGSGGVRGSTVDGEKSCTALKPLNPKPLNPKPMTSPTTRARYNPIATPCAM